MISAETGEPVNERNWNVLEDQGSASSCNVIAPFADRDEPAGWAVPEPGAAGAGLLEPPTTAAKRLSLDGPREGRSAI